MFREKQTLQVLNGQYPPGWKQAKLNKKCTPVLQVHTYSKFSSYILLIKYHKIQLPVLLSIAVLHQLYQQIHLFKIFRTLFNLYISEKIFLSQIFLS